MISLAVKYRPTIWEDVCGQTETVHILKHQLETNTVKNAYLFTGPAGCGKTTCARIFAKEINKGLGNPIELDAASNNSVDDIREIGQRAKTKSVDSEYKVFVLDEVHALSSNAWQAMLKLIEEPPIKSIFIMCTTDPQKIPKTILSRVQRYDFHKISHDKIVLRLMHVLTYEGLESHYETDALEYLSKISNGGMRDALSLLDKCLSYSTELSIDNVVKALGVADYNTMIKLTKEILSKNTMNVVSEINTIFYSGIDMKTFIRQYFEFILDVNKYLIAGQISLTELPEIEEILTFLQSKIDFDGIQHLADTLLKLMTEIKWDTNPRYLIEAVLIKESLK